MVLAGATWGDLAVTNRKYRCTERLYSNQSSLINHQAICSPLKHSRMHSTGNKLTWLCACGRYCRVAGAGSATDDLRACLYGTGTVKDTWQTTMPAGAWPRQKTKTQQFNGTFKVPIRCLSGYNIARLDYRVSVIQDTHYTAAAYVEVQGLWKVGRG